MNNAARGGAVSSSFYRGADSCMTGVTFYVLLSIIKSCRRRESRVTVSLMASFIDFSEWNLKFAEILIFCRI